MIPLSENLTPLVPYLYDNCQWIYSENNKPCIWLAEQIIQCDRGHMQEVTRERKWTGLFSLKGLLVKAGCHINFNLSCCIN